MPLAPNAKFVPWSGPENGADLAMIGEAPGPTENRKQVPFSGKSGHYADRFLSMAGHPRSHTFVWNVVHYWPGKGEDGKQLPPDQDDIERDSDATLTMLREVKPKVIAAVGKVAASFFTGLSDSLEILHGKLIPPKPEHRLSGSMIVPCYHPAAGMYSPSLMEKVYWDFQQVGLALRGDLMLWPSQRRVKWYRARDLMSHRVLWRPGPMGFDTEGTPEKPISLQFAFNDFEGVVCEEPLEIEWFYLNVLPLAKPVVMHNAPWDLRVAEKLGILIPPGSFVDTMMLGYHIRAEQKPRRDDSDDGEFEGAAGLKDLSRRHLGRFMRSYEDTLAPTIMAKFRDIVAERYCMEVGALPPQLTKSGRLKKKKQKAVELTQIGKRLENLISVLEDREVGQLRSRWNAMVREFPDEKLPEFPTATLDEIPREDFLAYAAADPAATVGVYPALRAEHRRKGLERVEEIDLGAIPMFARMNQVGMIFARGEALELGRKFERDAAHALAELEKLAGRPINPGSVDDLRWLLYRRMGMRPPHRTPKGDPSTDEKALALLKQRAEKDQAPECAEAVDLILRYREANKHLRTYILPLFDRVRADGSVSPDLMLTNTATGRPAGLFLTFPAHTEDGKKIRSLFKARPGCEFVTVDLSQIEMRVMAHAADEPTMKKAFRDGKDLHVFTASEMFHVRPEKVEKLTQRTPAKMIGFGIIYGLGGPGLMKNLMLPPPQGPGLRYTLEEAEALIERWYEVFPGVRKFHAEEKRKLRLTGETRGLFGRLRYLPTIWSPDEFERAEAERAAINHPIQDGAQCIEKMGMARIWPRMGEIRRQVGYAEPILQIHDELVFEVREGKAEEVAEIVGEELVKAGSWMDVPVEWGKAVGSDWGSLEK